jgi:hypothetical protein
MSYYTNEMKGGSNAQQCRLLKEKRTDRLHETCPLPDELFEVIQDVFADQQKGNLQDEGGRGDHGRVVIEHGDLIGDVKQREGGGDAKRPGSYS